MPELATILGDSMRLGGPTTSRRLDTHGPRSVKDKDLTTPPVSPVTGDQYIVAAGSTGAWSGKNADIARWDGTAWTFETPEEGWLVWVDDEDSIYGYGDSGWKLTAGDAISSQTGAPSASNRNMVARATAMDGDLACDVAVANDPIPGSYPGVTINGNEVTVGDGTKVGHDCYFSSDSGATARDFDDIATGDTMHWNGSVAGYELSTSDIISFDYDTVS